MAYTNTMNYKAVRHYNKNINYNAANKAATQVLNSFFNPCSITLESSKMTKPLLEGGAQGEGGRALINTPVFLVNQGGKQVTVQLSYYLASNAPSFTSNTLKTLINALTQVYGSVTGQPISVQLELVRQHQPYMDASILAQYLAINLSKHGFSRIMNLLLNAVPYLSPNYAFNLSYITGVKVQLSGLLTSQRNRSRKTVYTVSAGTFHNNSSHLRWDLSSKASTGELDTNNLVTIDYGSYTSKSGLGAFTVKV